MEKVVSFMKNTILASISIDISIGFASVGILRTD